MAMHVTEMHCYLSRMLLHYFILMALIYAFCPLSIIDCHNLLNLQWVTIARCRFLPDVPHIFFVVNYASQQQRLRRFSSVPRNFLRHFCKRIVRELHNFLPMSLLQKYMTAMEMLFCPLQHLLCLNCSWRKLYKLTRVYT